MAWTFSPLNLFGNSGENNFEQSYYKVQHTLDEDDHEINQTVNKVNKAIPK